MATESVILTALPNGIHPSGALKVTVFVSPRLSTDGPPSLPLSAFPSFVDWPKTFRRLRDEARLVVEVEGSGPVATDLDPDAPPPDPATWALLFDPDRVGVVTGTFTDLSNRRVLTYPTASVVDQILSLYRDVATNSPTTFPPATSGRLAVLGRVLGMIGFNPGEFYKSLDGRFTGGPPGTKGRYFDQAGLSPAQAQQLAFVQAQRFYDRPKTRDPLGPTAIPDPPKPPDFDFHSYCASLGDYPRLLRPLGLAVDLLAKRPVGLGNVGRIRMHVDALPSDLGFVAKEQARPWTRFQRQDRRFIPLPREREGDLADGTLRLENDKVFRVHQIDVDGSALKTINFAGNVSRIAAHLNGTQRSMSEDAASLPALRTGGFVVTRDDRARQLVGQIDNSAAHEADHASGTAADLYAEEVARGFRPDVQDDSGTWRTLTAREGTYVVERPGGPEPVDVKPDEGFVKGASTTSVPGEADADLYLHEAVFGWEGWSLAAKRPGQAIVDNAGHEVGTVEPKPPSDFPLVTQFSPTPGSLPRLRFGRRYRFRARAVDLAGNSVPEADVVAQHQTSPALFLRFDPVPSPAVVPRRRVTEGESLLRMVIRSTLGILPTDYVALARIKGLAGHTDPATAYLDANERHLAAPKTAVQLAEWHAMFDVAIGLHATQADVDAQFDIAAREAGSFIEPGAGAAVVNPNPAATPTDLATLHRGDPLQPGEYVVRDTDDLALPYLPDPLSAGASFTTLPGDAATRTQGWPGGAWPDRKPIRIRIVDGGETTAAQKAPSWEAGPRLLTVFLRQAELVTVRLSSFPIDGGLDVLGVWNLEPAAIQAAQAADAKAGRHWMLTPYQDLTIVHAVEKPLTSPVVSVDDVGVQRNLGETFAVLQGRIDNHARSTGRLDLDAVWTQPVDDLAKDAPNDADNLGEIEGAAHVVDFLLEASEDGCRTGRDEVAAAGATSAIHRVRHEFRDTLHRNVTYHATATTRFREYFPPAITDDASLITNVGPAKTLNVPSSRRPDPPEVLYVVPTFRWTNDVFRGLVAGLTADVLQPKVATALAGIRNSAQLFAAGVREGAVTLPQGVRLPTVTRRIRSAGLRVYLDRPWYSSGAGELLAVVVPDQPYIVWPIDLENGLIVEAAARVAADEAAGRLLAQGTLKPAGGGRLSPTERLVAGARKLTDPSPGDRTDVALSGSLSAFQVAQLTGSLAAGNFVFQTGDPEQFVTRWGNDPIWGSDTPDSGPWIHQFPLRTQVGTGLSLAEAPGNTVAAIGHRPRFDPARGLWYCDIDIDAGTSYFPFVRLGLARYQPSSIPGTHLSRVVTPEWGQLAPDRTASLTRPSGSQARVTLRGPAGYNDVAETVLGGSAATGLQGMNLSRFAVAQVERLPAGATTDLAWLPTGDEVRLSLSIAKAYSDIVYSGSVPIPKAASGEELRLTIREYEMLQTDLSQADDIVQHDTFTVVPVQPPEVGPPVALVPHPDDKPVRFRLVYADHLAL